MNRKTKIALATFLAATVAVVALLWTFHNVHTARALAASQSSAQLAAPPVAPSISYQGRLTDSSGSPVDDGVYTMTFSIYDVPSGGIALWMQTSAVTVTNGLFNVALGEISNPIDAGIFPGGPRWLGVQVDPDPEMMPRQPFDSIPYAIIAENLRSGGMTSDTSSGALYTFTNNGSGPALVTHGDVHVDGGLTWYTRTGYVSVGPAAFVPRDESYEYARTLGLELYPDTPGTDADYYASLALPHGATVTKFTAYYYDNSSDVMTITLRCSNMGASSYEMALVESSGTGYGSTDDTSIDYAAVDNETRAYFVRVQFPTSPYADTLNFKGAVVEYEYTEPY